MYDRTTVRPCDRATVRPCDRATVRPCDRATVRPYDRATVRPYDRTTVHDATFNMRDQLYRGHTNARARRCTLETCGKKMRAPLLGLAKSIYYAIFNSKGHLRISLK